MSLALAVSLASSPALAADRPPVILKRVDKWVVNYAADGCNLFGAFGEGDDRVIMRLSRFSPGETFDLMLAGKPVRTTGGLQSRFSIDFGPTVDPHTVRSLNGTSGKQPMVMLGKQRLDDASPYRIARQGGDDTKIVEAPLAPEMEAAVTWFEFQGSGQRYRLEMGGMMKPMAAMRQCTDRLVKSWGLDPLVQSTLRSGPEPLNSIDTWLTTKDYPTVPMMSGKSGVVQFRLDVDAVGIVTGCHIQQATQNEELQKKTCSAIESRARFSPALDAGGKAVPSYYVGTVRWLAQPPLPTGRS